MSLTRRGFLVRTSAAGLAGSTAVTHLYADSQDDRPAGAGAASHIPAQDPALVREMVGVSHGNIARVRELLKGRPELSKAAWDWGFGDWESALGAASHVGNREIATILIEHGARPDIFTFAMLGHLDVVKSYIKASPGIQRTLGPHGITLLSHASAGGEQAAEVVRYLESVGDADRGYKSQPLSESDLDRYLGDYAFGSAPRDRFTITAGRNGGLTIQRIDGAPRGLIHLGDHQFHPVGASHVRIKFELRDKSAHKLIITEPEPLLTATRTIKP
jgi:hypothetical protein